MADIINVNFETVTQQVPQQAYSGIDTWTQMTADGLTVESIETITQVPGVTRTLSNSNKVIAYDFEKTFAAAADAAGDINSNVQTGEFGAGAFTANIPSTAVSETPELTVLESGAKLVDGGSTLASIADKVSLAVVGVSLGTKLGKAIDGAIYNADPDYWDNVYPYINPETWDDIATSQGGKSVIRAIFGLQNDEATMYVDERLLAYQYLLMQQQGAYDLKYAEDGSTIINGVKYGCYNVYYGNYQFPLSSNVNNYAQIIGDCFIFLQKHQLPQEERCNYYLWNTKPFIVRIYNRYGQLQSEENSVKHTATINGIKYDYYGASGGQTGSLIPNQVVYTQTYSTTNPNLFDEPNVIAFLYNVKELPAAPGYTNDPRADIQIDPAQITETAPEPVLAQMKQLYPALFADAAYEDVMQPDGSLLRYTYVPVPFPDISNINQPVTGEMSQVNVKITPDTATQTMLQQIVDLLTAPATEPPPTGEGETPPVVIPTGSANALYTVYNPTQSELNSFGGWLWSENFVDQLLKMFNDPMQAIIGLHKVFATPEISGTGTIKVGYLDSKVSSKIVGNQYVTVDCGEISLPEYFGNVFDYSPYTNIDIFLPFIGIEHLNTGDVMRSKIRVIYHVDVITGACIAEVNVTRDLAGGVIYTYSGNCAVQYPLSSGSYMGILSSIVSIAGGVAGTIASGGALAPLAIGAVRGVSSAHTNVERSGSFSGNAGAMASKIPYLIITRPQPYMAQNFEQFTGYPANQYVKLGECSGFVQVNRCHLDGINAMKEELVEIENILKEGIII